MKICLNMDSLICLLHFAKLLLYFFFEKREPKKIIYEETFT